MRQAAIAVLAFAYGAFAQPPDAAKSSEWFESTVKPVLRANCWACHSARNRTSGLALDSRDAILAGGNRGPAVRPGQSAASLLMAAVRHEGAVKMPPTTRLKEEQVEVLRAWIDAGVPWSGTSAKIPGADHWAFQPIRRPAIPEVRNSAWTRNAIDRFIAARLEKENLQPSPEADKYTLLRRVSLDLTGLPPSPAGMDAFLADSSPDAYERVVDRLLASPHYGERWGRHWLDLARYADSDGYNIDSPRPMWKYRDWVINALNGDMPFDQFVIEQIAGDLLPHPTADQLIATGFHRNTLLNLEGGIDFEQYRVEAVADRVDTTGVVFLGLTVGCARCHDHKYDPVSQRDFYRLYAFFNNIDEMTNGRDRGRAHEPVLEFPTRDQSIQRETIRKQIALLEEELKLYQESLDSKFPVWEKEVRAHPPEKMTPELLAAVNRDVAGRTEIERDELMRFFHEQDLGWKERRASIAALRRREPKVDAALILRELPSPRESYIHLGGDFLRKGEPVEPGTPQVLPQLPGIGESTRLDLARWLVSKQNPLTSRVMVNRVWQRYFGRGLVATENDFGTQGAEPVHPDLLDWLASEFMASGWKLKVLHRTIVTSAAYRQASANRSDLAQRDPGNQLVARQHRLRLEAEIIRDAALAASGLLSPKIGGPSVYPPLPEGAMGVTQVNREWPVSKGEDRYRRGMYTFFWRSAPHPALMAFDAPDATAACTRRNRSNTPLQSLTTLNNEAFFEAARHLARRIVKESAAEDTARVEHAFRLVLARPPSPGERDRLITFVQTEQRYFEANEPEVAALAADPGMRRSRDLAFIAAWISASRALLNLDEFLTRE
ncbi:MAG TPA: PSD1 and planctomycete cytochrome C domain-containing protein [Bryobacteraceae bacterium]|nr:PSD1 and planctomycete cytochrome C domain-containing protein [Bryobacteraceae bacterium]